MYRFRRLDWIQYPVERTSRDGETESGQLFVDLVDLRTAG